MKKYKESDILIIISALKNIISIFFGPFLTAYFIKVSTESLIDLSIYNIMNYIVLGLGGIVIGWIIRNRFQIGMFRIGIISNFVYILTIIILKEKILEHLYLISFLYGFSAITYHYPYNLFVAYKISNRERVEYEFKKKTTATITSIITPIVLGSIIVTTNFQLSAIIILIISLIQIILSFFIKSKQEKNYKYTPIKSLKLFIKNKDVRNMLWVDYFKGLSISSSVLSVVLTILIFNAFKTELNLGILSSIASIFIIIIQYMYTKKFKNKNDRLVILLSSIIPMISLFFLLLFTNNLTLILYYISYNTLVNLLLLILDVRLFNISNCEIVKNNNEMEFWAIRELVLNLGRITGYLLLFLIAMFNKFDYLYYLMLILTLAIVLMAQIGSKVQKYDDID